MPAEVDCLNDALSQLGAATITDIADGSTNANHCLRLYPALRDGLLRSAHWNFAMTRVELAQDVTPPLFEFSYAYTLPADCLKLVEYNGANTLSSISLPYQLPVPARYKVEGRKIYTNDGNVKIRYLRRVENPDEWDGLFYQVVATWLASKLSMAITKDAKMSAALMSSAVNVLLPLALAVDGQEDSVEPFFVDNLIVGR